MWTMLAELSYFFRQLCAKELSQTVIADLEKNGTCLALQVREDLST
jgi:hypothetical protein